MNIFLLIVGTFMDITPAILIFTPIFLPIVTAFGMDPVHFGIMLVLNLCVGNITPPVGSALFAGASVAKLDLEDVIKTSVTILWGDCCGTPARYLYSSNFIITPSITRIIE